jgi:hypothetical protein
MYLHYTITHPSSATVGNSFGDVSEFAEVSLLTDVLAFELTLFNILLLALITRGLPLPLGSFGESTTGFTSMGEAVNNKLGLSGQSSTNSKNTSVFGIFAIDSRLPGGASWDFKSVVEL